MIEGLLGIFCLAQYVIVFLPFSSFLFAIKVHLTDNSVSYIVIFVETCNSERTESTCKY
jgi:hypothetical protein